MAQSQRATTESSEHGDELPLVDEGRVRAILDRIGFGKVDVVRADAILADLSAGVELRDRPASAHPPQIRESLPPRAPSLPPTDVTPRLSSRPPEGERTSSIPPLAFPDSERPESARPLVIDLEAQTNASGEAYGGVLSDSISVDLEDEPAIDEVTSEGGGEQGHAVAEFRASIEPSLAKHISENPDEDYDVDDETSVADEARAVFVDLSSDRESTPAGARQPEAPLVSASEAPPSRPAIRPGSVERQTRELTMPEVTPGMLSALTQGQVPGASVAPTVSDTDVPTARVSSQPPHLQFDDEETARADSIPPLPPPAISSLGASESAPSSAARPSSRSIPIAHLGRTEPPPLFTDRSPPMVTDRSPPMVTDRSPPPSSAPSMPELDWPSGESFDATPASDLRVEDLDPGAAQAERDEPVIEIGRMDATAIDPDLLDATPHSGEDLDALLNTELPVERETFRRRSELPEHASEEELAELLDEEIFPDEFEDLTNTPSAEMFRSDPPVAVINVDADDEVEARTDASVPAITDPKSGVTESIPPAPAVLAAAARADARAAAMPGQDEEDTFFAGEDETEVVTSDHVLSSSFPPRAGIDTARKDLPEDPPTVTVRGNRRAAVQAAARAIAAGQTAPPADGLPEPEVTENSDTASPSAPPAADAPAPKQGFFKKIFGR